jgi:hypothetical protein
MIIKVWNVFCLLFIVIVFGCESKDNSIIPIVPPGGDSIPSTDYRTKYVGNYDFNLKLLTLEIYPDTAYWSTQLFQYRGTIELYNKDRLLIKYSSFQPLGRCLNGTSWCQGGLSDPCVTNCGGQLYYVRNWVSPLIYSNDSLLLFKDYSRLNGSGSFIKDTISFVTRLYDKWSVYEEHITGIKIKQ